MSHRRVSPRLTLPSDMRVLPVARAFIEAVCQSGGLDEDVTYAVVLAASEAITNVIRHAHRDAPDAPLQVECRFRAGGIEICLRDRGSPFDLAKVPVLDPAEIRLGGRGIFLMRKLMDELHCRPRRSGGNLLRMVKRCRRPTASIG